ncbi:hypothetical protein MSP8886_01744 [Marinomonas spartinae]|uniref:Bacterial extracellular solute-binding protein n=1 Tax=Marinomonas spartinae TaxID=1792290 RepID=A0A1A8TBC2_9GAMM|nr:ABC transporter substrate-binding protein [Marinomonas spartinae]SBS30247.1 hypothetical protein MSP8886_01744 [Marinomonas spartinae]
MKWFIILLSVFFMGGSQFVLADPEQRSVEFGQKDAPRVLRIHSSIDLASFGPLIEGFVQRYPNIRVSYKDINTLEMYNQTIHDSRSPQASLVISSAMDLQIKLVNDGYAQTYHSFLTDQLPNYAQWRHQVFAFSLEPVVMLVNKDRYPGPLPKDRQDILQTIRQYSNFMKGRIGTYDIRKSGVGYLLASQDARQADTTWGRLLEAFGSHQVKTYCCTHEIIDKVASGKLVLGYNLLGSYVAQRVKEDTHLKMILPKDYSLMVMRVGLIPKKAPNAHDAGLFLDYLLTNSVQKRMQVETLMFPIKPDVMTKNTLNILGKSGPQRVVELDQQLLVGRDFAKQYRFIKSWEEALEITH